jgi:hypothetical protein
MILRLFALLLLCAVPAAAADYQLPPKSVFPAAMPRYPNLWVYVEKSLARDYAAAVRLVTEELRRNLFLVENHGKLVNPEGCDFEATVEHLQPWQGPDRALQHAHAFHIRYYNRPLEAARLHEVQVEGVSYYRIAASAHYEVEHFNPNHPDVESCPICGRTGWYAAEKGSLVERVHDPLGVELATMGKIRERPVSLATGEKLGGICNVQQTFIPTEPWMNTQRLAIVTLRTGWEKEKIKCLKDID